LLFIDNLQDAYSRKTKTWGEIHELLDDTQSAVFASGNEELELLLEKRDRAQIQKLKGCILPNLNLTKIRKFYSSIDE
jgi:hypothetical protein